MGKKMIHTPYPSSNPSQDTSHLRWSANGSIQVLKAATVGVCYSGTARRTGKCQRKSSLTRQGSVEHRVARHLNLLGSLAATRTPPSSIYKP